MLDCRNGFVPVGTDGSTPLLESARDPDIRLRWGRALLLRVAWAHTRGAPSAVLDARAPVADKSDHFYPVVNTY